MTRARLQSWLRRSLIVLLTISAALLTVKTLRVQGAGSPTRAAVSSPAEPEAQGDSGESGTLLQPRAVLVFRKDAGNLVSTAEGEVTTQAFGRFAALLGETLGSAGAAQVMTGQELRRCLEEEGVFLDLGAVYPLELLARWLGGGQPGSALGSADLLCLLPGEETVELCYRSGSGGFFRCGSSAKSETLRRDIAEFSGTPAVFAFQEGVSGRVDPFFVLPAELPSLYAAAASVPSLSDAESLMSVFGMNSYAAASYRETDGTRVFIEDEQTLRVSPDGRVQYRAGTGRDRAATESEAIDLALRLARRALGPVCGAAELRYAASEKSDGALTVWLDYSLRGVPVRLGAGHAAELVFRGGTLRRASLLCRSFALSDQVELLPPARFAAAIAAAKGEGSPALAYRETAEGLRCLWVNN